MKKIVMTVDFICEVADDTDIEGLCLEMYEHAMAEITHVDPKIVVEGEIVGYTTVNVEDVSDDEG